MTLDVKGRLTPSRLDELEAVTVGQRTLEDVVCWALSHEPPLLIQDIVVQDEYTHDVVLRYRDDLYLVYDTT